MQTGRTATMLNMLPDELLLWCFLFLEFGDRCGLVRACRRFRRISRDPALLPTVLDLRRAVQATRYLEGFLSDTRRRLSVNRLILPHTPSCGYRDGCVTRPDVTTGYTETKYTTIRHVDPRNPQVEHHIKAHVVLHDCPNITTMCLPCCQISRALIIYEMSDPKAPEGSVFFSAFRRITHLETDSSNGYAIERLLNRLLINVHSYRIPLDIYVMNRKILKDMSGPEELTLVCTTSILSLRNWKALCAWVGRADLHTLRIQRPYHSTTCRELQKIAALFDPLRYCTTNHAGHSGSSSNDCKHLNLQLWDSHNESRHQSIEWIALLAMYPYISVHQLFIGNSFDVTSRCW